MLSGIAVHADDASLDKLRRCLREADEPGALPWKVFALDRWFVNDTEPLSYQGGAILAFDSRATGE